jgi:hypothetical protein
MSPLPSESPCTVWIQRIYSRIVVWIQRVCTIWYMVVMATASQTSSNNSKSDEQKQDRRATARQTSNSKTDEQQQDRRASQTTRQTSKSNNKTDEQVTSQTLHTPAHLRIDRRIQTVQRGQWYRAPPTTARASTGRWDPSAHSGNSNSERVRQCIDLEHCLHWLHLEPTHLNEQRHQAPVAGLCGGVSMERAAIVLALVDMIQVSAQREGSKSESKSGNVWS